jgi:hypothetical protein
MPLRKDFQVFPRVYNAADFGITSSVCQPSLYSQVGSLTVPYGQVITFGIGGIAAGVDSRSVSYIKLTDNTGTVLNGKIRLSLTDPNGVKEIVVAEQRTERFAADSADRNKAFLLGEYYPIRAQEQSKLVIKFYPDSATAVTVYYGATTTNTVILMPVTVWQ